MSLPPKHPFWIRCLCLAGGWIALALAVVGAILPVMPWFPFFLLALFCFARSSPRIHAKLREIRFVRPLLDQWERDKSVPRNAKRKAYLLVVVSFSVSIALLDSTGVRIGLALFGLAVLAVIASLRTTEEPSRAAPSRAAKPHERA